MIFVAQGRASSGDVGRQVKMRLRIGVSETPVGLYGPRTRHHLDVRQIRDAVLMADVGVGDARADRREVVVHRPLERADERGGDALRAGAHRAPSAFVSSMPFGSACDMPRGTSSSATRSPFTETSTFSSKGDDEP